MPKTTLTQTEEADLINSYRIINDVINNLMKVTDGVIQDSTIENLKETYQRLETELGKRGYSQEELADIS